jgi:hypothetical protein
MKHVRSIDLKCAQMVSTGELLDERSSGFATKSIAVDLAVHMNSPSGVVASALIRARIDVRCTLHCAEDRCTDAQL